MRASLATATFLLCTLAYAHHPAEAQDRRVREVASLQLGTTRVTLIATDEAEFMGVRMFARQGINRVEVFSSTSDAWNWARLADSLIAHPHRARSRETVEAETSFGGGYDVLRLVKRTSNSGTTFRVHFRDRYGINATLAEVGPSRARELVEAIRRTAVIAGEMNGVDPTRQPSLPVPDAPTLPRRPIGNPAWPIIGDSANGTYYYKDCGPGKDFLTWALGAPYYQVEYFESHAAAEAAGFRRALGSKEC